MSLRPFLFNRDHSPMLITPKARFIVKSMSWAAQGGPEAASITAYGDLRQLWKFIELLRCGMWIVDDVGRRAWWGFVSEVRVRDGALEVGATIDSLVNRVRVAYSFISKGSQDVGFRKTTAWAEDAKSIAEFGYKEWTSSQGGMTDAAAENRRDTILEAKRWPQGVPQQLEGRPKGRARYSGAQDSASATIYCRGWWSTLDWRYYSQNAGAEEYTTTGQNQAMGSAAGTTKVEQSFQLLSPTAWSAELVKLHCYKTGTPADNLTVEICADSSGAPGTVLASGTLAGGSVGTSAAWTEIALSARYMLQPSTTYHLVVRRSGANDGSNYYNVSVAEALGYTRGVFRIWGGTSWAARSPDADLSFQVEGDQETTDQVKTIIGQVGQFITGTTIRAGSGVYTNQYRDGEMTGLAEVDELLKLGGPNDRRMLARVLDDRWVTLEEEPASTTVEWLLDRFGTVRSWLGVRVLDYMPPYGVYIRLKEVIPSTVNTSMLIDPTLQFVERAEWSEDSGLRLGFRGQPSIEDMLRMKEY